MEWKFNTEISNSAVIIILLLKFDKVLKDNFNWSILQQLIVRLSNMDYKN